MDKSPCPGIDLITLRNSVYKKVRLLDVSVRGHACLQSGNKVRGNSETLTATASKSKKNVDGCPGECWVGLMVAVFPIVFPRGVMVFQVFPG